MRGMRGYLWIRVDYFRLNKFLETSTQLILEQMSVLKQP